MPRPIVTVVAPSLVHVALPELGLAMHVLLRTRRVDVTLAGALVQSRPFGRA